MTRSTLKLPQKPKAPAAADEARSPFRKPARSGSKAPKQSLGQRAEQLAERLARNAEVNESTLRPRFSADRKREAAVQPAPVRPEARERAKPVPESEEYAPRPNKIYPKRGIARSTGARALPPARQPGESPVTSVSPAPTFNGVEAGSRRRPVDEPPRLSKRISELRQCSRREADEWIENGWVRVDGVVVTTLGIRVSPAATIEIREEAGQHRKESVTILFNKPPGKLGDTRGSGGSGVDQAQKLIRPAGRWAEDESRVAFKATHLRGLEQVGQLDDEASGMLVFTQENSVVRRITGDDIRLEKEFMVRVSGEIAANGLKLLNQGLSLDDVKLRRAQVSWQSELQLRFVLHETRPRQIQRMCELVGLIVESIKLIRIGSVSLGKLPAGQWRYLRENERF